MRLLAIWDVGKSLRADTSGFLLYRHRKMSAYMYWNILCIVALCIVSNSQTSEIVWYLTQASPPTETDVFCLYTHRFYPSIFVGSSAAESMSTVFCLGRMENDVNAYLLPNPFCFYLICCYISLYLRVSVFVKNRMDFGVKKSERMFFNVVQIQLNTSLYSQFTASQRAHVIIAVFWLKLTGSF